MGSYAFETLYFMQPQLESIPLHSKKVFKIVSNAPGVCI